MSRLGHTKQWHHNTGNELASEMNRARDELDGDMNRAGRMGSSPRSSGNIMPQFHSLQR
jgi:hypothetical protein